MKKIVFLVFLTVLSTAAKAQYWHAIPFVESEHPVNPGFSDEDKKGNFRAYYLDRGNIFGVDGKKFENFHLTHVVPDAPIVRMFHLLGKPQIVYMQASSGHPTDYHLFRIADTGEVAPEDLTPTKEGVQNLMLGASYNGRYIYYSSNKTNLAKTDYYRYDIAQNISELVFANDKKYELLGWSRDQNLVLLEDPATGKLFASDVQTTERYPFYTSKAKVLSAGWSVDAKQIHVLEDADGVTTLLALPLTSPTSIGAPFTPIGTGMSMVQYSGNGKFTFETKAGVLSIKEAASGNEIYSSPDLVEAMANGKETMIFLVSKTVDGLKLSIYDVAKKTTKDLPWVVSH